MTALWDVPLTFLYLCGILTLLTWFIAAALWVFQIYAARHCLPGEPL